ncbi:hypothetical protein [Streptomyces sp. CB01881]|uniref:hypothetical protein n=1 Tax=Streptomyces sp. CB01881 TaxID=2078691 RepID=UPI000CDBB186|nr:hypothetical protein [Streptomyces sp. CB01881]AUY52847.1 hypothetical protein C2142_32490 [Streptomyces sp. CB01881]TYC70565.1 hypothetical protein EH183_32555 [Streptomyces sp. CB01881]
MAYRHWCGECGYKTAWLPQPESEEQQIQHYAKHHPGIPPGGSVEVNRSDPNRGPGCLPALGFVVLLLILAASCRR